MTRVVALLLAITCGSAVAEEQVFKASITPFIGTRIGGRFEDEATGERLELEDGNPGFGLLVNWRHSEVTEWEVSFSHQDTSIDTAGLAADYDIAIDYLQLGGTVFGDGLKARPYLVATVGAAFLDPEPSAFDSEIYFSFSIGGGLNFFPASRFGLRAEGRLYGTVLDSDSRIFCASGEGNAGCLISTKADVLWQFEALLGAIVRF